MTNAIRAMAAALALAALAAGAAAQEPVPAGADFRVEVEPDPLSRRGPAVVGWLYNDRGFAIGNVRLRVEVLDDGGQVLGAGEGWLYGNVPGRGRAYFFISVPRRGAAYRVNVIGYDRLERGL